MNYRCTTTMTRLERVKTAYKVLDHLYHSIKLFQLVKKQSKVMRQTKSTHAFRRLKHRGLDVTIIFTNGGQEFRLIADIGVNNFEFSHYTRVGPLLILTEHFLARYNQRMDLQLTSMVDILKHFYLKEGIIEAPPRIQPNNKISYRTPNGSCCGHIASQNELNTLVIYLNTWLAA